jgi:hypothetical protein
MQGLLEGFPFQTVRPQAKPKGLPPTEKQLAYIEGLAKRHGVAVPSVETLEEAKKVISTFVSLTPAAPADNAPSEKQVHYLRSLAYDRLGSSSEDWVQSKVKEGRKAVSEAINDLVGQKKK